MGAKRRWIPLSTEFPHDKTGTRLQEEFGPAGLAVWVALLTAAKRGHVQGTFSYRSEEGGWEELGILDPPFALDDFLKVTGQMKQTRRRQRGRVTDVQITAWGQWNDAPRTGSGRLQNPMSEDDSARQQRAYDIDSDIDSDSMFQVFNSNRAAAEVLQRKRRISIVNPAGYARTIATDPEFVKESTRLWAHRECGNCRGKGFTEVYAPNAGTRQIPCGEPT